VVNPKDRNRGDGHGSRGELAGTQNRLGQLSRELDRIFEDSGRAPFGTLAPGIGGRTLGALWMPAIEVQRDDGEIVVRADLPGVEMDDLKVDIEGQTLTIQGERRRECHENDGEGHDYRSERRYGAFFRSIPLPTEVDPDDVRAEFQDGVLEVHVPTPGREESRKRIEVRGRQGDSTGSGRSRP
jgi:HSP20 family protein